MQGLMPNPWNGVGLESKDAGGNKWGLVAQARKRLVFLGQD